MILPESPEIPWESPKWKQPFNFASDLTNTLLTNANVGKGVSLRSEQREKALLEEFEQQEDENGVIRVSYKIMEYMNALYVGGDFQGAKEVGALFISKALIELMKDQK